MSSHASNPASVDPVDDVPTVTGPNPNFPIHVSSTTPPAPSESGQDVESRDEDDPSPDPVHHSRFTEGDVEFLSNDNVIFTTKSWWMRSFSKTYGEMIELPASQRVPAPIPLDIDSMTCERLFANCSFPLDDRVVEIPNLKAGYDLLRAMDLLRVERCHDKIYKAMRHLAEKSAWKVFVLADKYDWLDLARLAIRNFDNAINPSSTRNEKGLHPADLPDVWIDQVRPMTFRSYIRAYSDAVTARNRVDWDKVAAAFVFRLKRKTPVTEDDGEG